MNKKWKTLLIMTIIIVTTACHAFADGKRIYDDSIDIKYEIEDEQSPTIMELDTDEDEDNEQDYYMPLESVVETHYNPFTFERHYNPARKMQDEGLIDTLNYENKEDEYDTYVPYFEPFLIAKPVPERITGYVWMMFEPECNEYKMRRLFGDASLLIIGTTLNWYQVKNTDTGEIGYVRKADVEIINSEYDSIIK